MSKSKQELQRQADILSGQKVFLEESIEELRVICAKMWTVKHFIYEVVETLEESGDLYDGDKKDKHIGQAFEKHIYESTEHITEAEIKAQKLLELREEQLQYVKDELESLNY